MQRLVRQHQSFRQIVGDVSLSLHNSVLEPGLQLTVIGWPHELVLRFWFLILFCNFFGSFFIYRYDIWFIISDFSILFLQESDTASIVITPNIDGVGIFNIGYGRSLIFLIARSQLLRFTLDPDDPCL